MDDDLQAAAVFAAALEPRPGGRLRHGIRVAGAFVAELAWGLLPGPTVYDVVVRRRDDGEVVVRIPADEPGVPAHMLTAVRDELGAVAPEEFLARWSVPAH
ncbi:hypothetical protein SAMN05660359_02760 [Geodermatophilus obscurus]|uniref:Uncharacterized protein n=1 Tax=Geodermatophilus obscurus TaxID=1861 RepID=A0A1I5GCU5_9ACTN|nr:hypothetical protein [Geodermatophilus obscurus]SFO33683.1 hypothetical protein SAMN05660359_02760 [Geodermatophilus obscurus]